METETISEMTNVKPEQDKKIAKISLKLLFYISLLHGLWLIFRNFENIKNSLDISNLENLIFLAIFAIAVILNFIPPIKAKNLYKKGLYRKQIKVSIIYFTIFQILLHVILLIMSGYYSTAVC